MQVFALDICTADCAREERNNSLAHFVELKFSVFVGVENLKQSLSVLVEFVLVDRVAFVRAATCSLVGLNKIAQKVAQLVRVDASARISVVLGPNLIVAGRELSLLLLS